MLVNDKLIPWELKKGNNGHIVTDYVRIIKFSFTPYNLQQLMQYRGSSEARALKSELLEEEM